MRFMVLVIHLGPQTVDGERRHVRKAMCWNGHFALHLDYIGKALGISPDGVKYLRRECEKKGYLSEVHRGSYGRPSTDQALVVRGEELSGISLRGVLAPYGALEVAASGTESFPLTCKTPDQGERSLEECVAPGAVVRGKAQRRGELCADSDRGRPAICTWHPYSRCPDDCANAETNGRIA